MAMNWICLLLFTSFRLFQAIEWDCNRPWPDLELFLPLNTNPHPRAPDRDSEYHRIYLRSLLLFWPLAASKTKLFFLADAENHDKPETQRIHKDLLEVIAPHVRGGVRIEYNEPRALDSSRGHDRQQRLMLLADIWSRSEYVGFVDTDCLFVTYVDREDLFEDGRPVIIGRIGNFNSPTNGPGWDWWATIPATTEALLGLPEPMRCMSYFPVILKTAHIKALREYLEKKHGKDFETIFKEKFIDHPYSQFNVMCAYVWHFHRDEYKWYVNDISPGWDYAHPMKGQLGDVKQYTKEMRFPKPRIAIHTNYWSPGKQHMTSRDEANVLRTGVCLGPPFPKVHESCGFYSQEEHFREFVWEEMFKYEQTDWRPYLKPEDMKQAMYERFQRIQHCNHTYVHPDLKQLMVG